MNFNDYLDKLRSRPVHERQRIAVIATGVVFSIIFLIWIVSFSEMNKIANEEAESASLSDQLEEMKNQAGGEDQSIEEMMQGFSEEELNSEEELGEEEIQEEGTGNQDTGKASDESATTTENENQGGDDSRSIQQEIPQLP